MNQSHRQLASDLIQAFLSSKIDESHHEIYNQIKDSKDDTVRFACEILEELSEAYEDEPNLMDKEEWDHLERIRLVLLSGRHLTRRGNNFIIGSVQIVSVIALIAYLITLVCYGIDWYLVPVHIVSVAGLALGRLVKANRCKHPSQHITYPFTSFAQLAAAFSEANGFNKNRMPRDARRHQKTSLWFDIVFAPLFLLVFAPLFLLSEGLGCYTEHTLFHVTPA